MELEISNLHAQLIRVSSGSSVEKEQIAALEEKLLRSEKSDAKAQGELSDLKANLARTTEKAVKESSSRISAETKLRTLESEAAAAQAESLEAQKKITALEKKVATLATLHKEHDLRSQAQKRDLDKAATDAADLRTRLGVAENETLRLKEERERAKKRDADGVDDGGVDELENEEREGLEKKVRELESEVHDLRRGVWRERRKELQGDETDGLLSPGARFTDVDLNAAPRTRASGPAGLGGLLASGFNAITGGTGPVPASAEDDDGFLDDDDDLGDFDEDAFRKAQEEEGRKRLERVREVKRGLKTWSGWRLDLVEARRGGGEGTGEIFEV